MNIQVIITLPKNENKIQVTIDTFIDGYDWAASKIIKTIMASVSNSKRFFYDEAILDDPEIIESFRTFILSEGFIEVGSQNYKKEMNINSEEFDRPDDIIKFCEKIKIHLTTGKFSRVKRFKDFYE
jgi:hypothetical protein